MQNFPQTILSQFSNSPTLTQLITNLNSCISPDYNLEIFFDLLWNLDTAQSYGLDVWGRRVGIGRVLTVAQGNFLGFEGPTGASGDSLNVGIFYSGQATTGNFTMTDEAYRQLIFAKAAANITNGSVQAINAILMALFPNRGNAYVIDNGDMTMVYKFNFKLLPFEAAIVVTSGVLPTPTGVQATANYIPA